MNTPQLKICGLTTAEEVRVALMYPVDFLGLVFVEGHKNQVDPAVVSAMLDEAQKKACKIVAIFQNVPIEQVKSTCAQFSFDYIQLHGDEDTAYIDEVTNIAPVFKAFSLDDAPDTHKLIVRMRQSGAAHYILDRSTQGTGPAVDLRAAQEIAREVPIFLAGGLTAETVGAAIQQVRPYGIDMSGGIKTSGKLDIDKLRLVVEEVCRA